MNRSFLSRRFSLRTRLLWFLFSMMAGLFFVLAIPVRIPGESVERVQKILLNLNFHELFGEGLYPFLVVLLLGILIGMLLFAVSALLVNWGPRSDPKPPSRYEWLYYALPMLLMWAIYLLAFWPAMMSADSINNWQQAQTWKFYNDHPLVYELLIWLVTRVWNSPALFNTVQILCFSLLVGWGLGELRKRGLPAWVAWATAFVFAFSPVNGAMSVTIWKDIPYSLLVFALSLLILMISRDPQGYLEKKSSWLVLGVVAVFVGQLRYNGIVIAPLVFILLGLVYRAYWKVFARSLALFIVVGWVVNVPLNALLHVGRTSIVSGSLPLHHIAAHIYYRSDMSPQDIELVEQIMPLKDWRYYCYAVNSVMFNPIINKQFVMEHEKDLFLTSLRLFLKNPTVDIKHTACSSSLVYKVLLPREGYIYGAALYWDENGATHYLLNNNIGLKEASLLPGLHFWLMRLLDGSLTGNLSWMIWRPAVYLYFFLFVGCVRMLRAGSWKAGLYMVPGIIQSSTLFLVNIAQDFRYQYAIYLLGLFSLALLFLPSKAACPTDERAECVLPDPN